jgi:hypothetical protein
VIRGESQVSLAEGTARNVARSQGAQNVRNRVYEPPGRRQRRLTYLYLGFLPWMLAAYFFTPQYKLGTPDPVIERAHRWRTALAIVIGVVTNLAYFAPQKANTVANGAAESTFVELAVAALFLVPLFLLSAAILVFLSGPRWRLDAARQLLRPLKTIVFFFAFLGVLLLVTNVVDDRYHSWGAWGLLYVLVTLYAIVFWLCATFFATRHLFNAVDGHPLLPPLFAALVAWWQIPQKMIFPGLYTPLWVDLLLALGGAVVITALSAWEVRRLARLGITLASGPYPPLPPPDPAPQPFPSSFPRRP